MRIGLLLCDHVTPDLVEISGDYEELVREAADIGVPFIGICFGHQLLAKALGGTVVTSDRGWGVGVKEVQVSGGLSFMPEGVGSF